jgi:hypothetical protein
MTIDISPKTLDNQDSCLYGGGRGEFSLFESDDAVPGSSRLAWFGSIQEPLRDRPGY